jgi:hypothetical protein
MDTHEHILAENERELEKETAELAKAEATVARLKPKIEYRRMVVAGLRGLVTVEAEDGATDNGANPATEEGALARPRASFDERAAGRASGAAATASKMTYGGRPSIPAVILDVLGPYDASLDATYEAVCAHGAFEGRKKPSRGSVTNRLNDMAERGEIVKVRRGAYKSLAPTGATENPPEPGSPHPGFQLGAEKPRDGQLIAGRPGHPNNMEGAPGVVHRAGD